MPHEDEQHLKTLEQQLQRKQQLQTKIATMTTKGNFEDNEVFGSSSM